MFSDETPILIFCVPTVGAVRVGAVRVGADHFPFSLDSQIHSKVYLKNYLLLRHTEFQLCRALNGFLSTLARAKKASLEKLDRKPGIPDRNDVNLMYYDFEMMSFV